MNYASSPSISTLNTLAQFAGYANWREFKIKSNVKRPSFIESKVVPYLGIIISSTVVLTFILISFFSMTGIENKKAKTDFTRLKFSSQPVTVGLPNSVVFDFDLKGITSDSIYIQQFWDPNKTIKLSPHQKQATGIYYMPGYFRSKLLIDGQIIKEHDLFIKSKGWLGTIDYKPIPKYFSSKTLSHQYMSLPKAGIEEIALSEKPLVSSYHLVDDFGKISGDNIHIKTAVRYVYNDKWATCQSSRIVILGTKGTIIIPFSKLGCVSDINLMLNDVYINGKENDLSAFGVDLSEFSDISIDIKDKKVTISVDEETIYTATYHQTIGYFAGIRFRFLGAGEIDYLHMKGNNGKPVLEENF